MTDVAVAVVSWNTRELLGECLRSLAAAHDRGTAEVWVVDNASTDGSADLVRAEFPWVELIASERNLGFGAAANLVAERTSGPWLAVANADVAPEPDALVTLISAGDTSPDAGIIAPRLITPAGEVQHSVHSFPTVGLAAILASGLPRLSRGLGDRLCLAGDWDPARPRRVDWAHGAFLLVRRRAWEDVGGFDPGQWMYAEDLDLAWRLAAAGWSTIFEPTASVRHAGSAATAKAFGDERSRRFMSATFAWMVRRRGLGITRAYALVNLAGAGARWLTFSALAAVAPRRWSAARDGARVWVQLHRMGLRGRAELTRPGG